MSKTTQKNKWFTVIDCRKFQTTPMFPADNKLTIALALPIQLLAERLKAKREAIINPELRLIND